MAVKAILFDIDGMLVPHQEFFSQTLSRELHIPLEDINPFFQEEFNACLEGKADLKQVIAPYLKLWRWPKSVDAFLKYWFESQSQVNQELIQLIKPLQNQGIFCAVSTNQEKHRTRFLADKLGFLKLFDYLFVSSEIGHKKPAPEFLIYVFNSLRYLSDVEEKNEVMFWDDQPKKVEAAVKFGFDAHQFISNQDFKTILSQAGFKLD